MALLVVNYQLTNVLKAINNGFCKVLKDYFDHCLFSSSIICFVVLGISKVDLINALLLVYKALINDYVTI